MRKDTHSGGLLITVDELQVASGPDLALLAATLHRLNVDHPSPAVLFAGTGLPSTPNVLLKAGVTHPDRLFVLESIPLTLEYDDARYAVVEPARQAGVAWTPEAAAAVVEASNGYPAHLQLFAHAIWTAAAGPVQIAVADVEAALPQIADMLERRTLGLAGTGSATDRWSSWPHSPAWGPGIHRGTREDARPVAAGVVLAPRGAHRGRRRLRTEARSARDGCPALQPLRPQSLPTDAARGSHRALEPAADDRERRARSLRSPRGSGYFAAESAEPKPPTAQSWR